VPDLRLDPALYVIFGLTLVIAPFNISITCGDLSAGRLLCLQSSILSDVCRRILDRVRIFLPMIVIKFTAENKQFQIA